MRIYILNSAVITNFGSYRYSTLEATASEWTGRHSMASLKRLLQDPDNEVINTIRYEETQDAFNSIFETSFEVNNITIEQQPNELAIVFRLKFPKGYRPDSDKKGGLGIQFILANCEIGILSRVS